MLALYEPFTNTRMLVQQIGRLIRHPGPIGDAAPAAFVLAPKGRDIANEWNSFLAFDAASKANGNKPFVRNDATILENLIAALPTLDYVMGRFRERPDLDDPGLHDDLRALRLMSGTKQWMCLMGTAGNFTRSQLHEVAGSSSRPSMDWSILSMIDWRQFRPAPIMGTNPEDLVDRSRTSRSRSAVFSDSNSY
jgi:hypothetical protein